MDQVTRLPLELPGVPRKKVIVTFDGRRLSSAALLDGAACPPGQPETINLQP